MLNLKENIYSKKKSLWGRGACFVNHAVYTSALNNIMAAWVPTANMECLIDHNSLLHYCWHVCVIRFIRQ